MSLEDFKKIIEALMTMAETIFKTLWDFTIIKIPLIILFTIILIKIIIQLIRRIIFYCKKNKRKYSYKTKNYKKLHINDNQLNLKNNFPYEKNKLLTENELLFYKKLKPICDKNNIHIITKVRLADIANVKNVYNEYEKKEHFKKIMAKHIDFVLCNPKNLEIIALIELDDKSHERIDRIKSDIFKDELCNRIGIKLIRTYIENDIERQLIENGILKQKSWHNEIF